jgi:flagellar motility protein MotE (MotC chaperone)
MLKAAFVLTGLFSSILLMAQLLTLGLLWSRGYLTSDVVRKIQEAIAEQNTANEPESREAEVVQGPSQQELHQQRLVRVLELDTRESELRSLKAMTMEAANRLLDDRQQFDTLQRTFRSELEELAQRNQSEATQQTRAVLLASEVADAVQRLMLLKVEEASELLRGMPEKQIAKILQGFTGDPQQELRGRELFQALYHGDPLRETIEQTQQSLAAEAPSTAGP